MEELKNHYLWKDEHYSKEAPGIIYELRPIKGPAGEEAKGLHAAWITINNPAQYNSYTTQMVKGISDACVEAGCSLLGGETAEMPAVYAPGEFDMAAE